MNGQDKKSGGGLSALAGVSKTSTPSLSEGLRNQLAGLLQRPEVTGLYYNGRVITLDGYKFVGCRFDNCNLHISSLNFELQRCVIDQSTTITYGAAATKLIQLFNSRFEWAYEHFPGFVPVRNSDGTISISDNGR